MTTCSGIPEGTRVHYMFQPTSGVEPIKKFGTVISDLELVRRSKEKYGIDLPFRSAIHPDHVWAIWDSGNELGYMPKNSVYLEEQPYDPLQNGDTEEDI